MAATSRARTAVAVLVAAAAVAAACLALSAPAQAKPAGQPVVSQIYGGGGNIGAQYQNDFIEIFNRRGSPIDLSGWSVQYAAAGSAAWVVTPLSGTLGVGKYFLVAENNSGTANGIPLPAADATGTVDMSATSGKAALVSSFFPLSGTCPSGPQILDLVGYGAAASCFEGAGPTPNLSNTTAAVRKTAGCTDTNSNSADFSVLAPAPRNSATAQNLCFPIPATPVVTGTAPPSPSNDITPEVTGTAPAGTTVEIYSNAACSGTPLATGSAALFAGAGITATVAANSTTTFYALAFDANNSSACSATSATYVNDTIPPGAPTPIASSPASPGSDLTPEIRGSAAAGTTVRLYPNAACSGAPSGTGSDSAFASPGISVTVAAESTTTFYATAADAAGNVSPCSTSSVTYVQDSGPPAAPTFASSTPASPANDNSPLLIGAAEGGSTVRIYRDAACTNLAAQGSAAQFAAPGIGVTVPANSSTTFRATATDAVGNTSACSTSTLTYAEDSTPPPQPTLTATVPASPANDTTPLVVGSAAAGSTVDIYTDVGCTNLVASGTAAQFAAPGIAVAVAANSTTIFRATATDPVGNTSACSASSVTYVEDSTPPAAPTFTASTPASPANDTTPLIAGSADPGSTVRLYTGAACTGLVATGTAAQFASPGIAVTVAANSTTTFYATATDPVGNGSACSTDSLTYIEDSAAPAAPTFTASTPAPPANDTTPLIAGSADPGSTVRLYTDAACTDLAATGTDAQFAAPGIGVTVPSNSTTTFRATATDSLGNTSACSTSTLTYVEDSAPPPQPTFTASDPPSPSAIATPLLIGTAAAGSTVDIYTDAACTNLFASGTAALFAAPGIGVTVTLGTTTTFRATATDAVGNTSPCSSSSLTYEQDSGAPTPPNLTASVPASPSDSTTPRVVGSAEPGSTVRLYTDAACTALAGTGTAAELASPGIEVTVAPGSSTTFWATATDALDNTSACSAGSLTYVQTPIEPAPVLSGLRLTPNRFAITLKQTPVGAVVAAQPAKGTTIRFSLSAQARVAFTIRRRPPVGQPPAPSAGLIKTFGRLLDPGNQAIPFSGRLGQRLFRPGKYRMIVTARRPNGEDPSSASVPFKILPD